MKKKVYCKDCTYFCIVAPGRIAGTSAMDGCCHPEHCTYSTKLDSPLEPAHIYISNYGWAFEINNNNRCKWFERK